RHHARGERQRWLHLVRAADDEPVDEADARSANADQDIAGTRLRIRRLLDHEPIRRPELTADDAAHLISLGISQLWRAGERTPKTRSRRVVALAVPRPARGSPARPSCCRRDRWRRRTCRRPGGPASGPPRPRRPARAAG